MNIFYRKDKLKKEKLLSEDIEGIHKSLNVLAKQIDDLEERIDNLKEKEPPCFRTNLPYTLPEKSILSGIISFQYALLDYLDVEVNVVRVPDERWNELNKHYRDEVILAKKEHINKKEGK